MTQVPHIWIPLLALFCYLFLLLAFLAAKKTKLINAFILLLLSYMFWTSGSLCMRLQIYPGYIFWYNVSILSLFTIPFLLYNFVANFAGFKGYLLKIVWFVGTILVLFFTYLQVFLKYPELVNRPDGSIVFLYRMDWWIVIPCIFFVFVLSSIPMLVIRQIHEREISMPWVRPILIGMIVLFVGNMLSIVPKNIFPWDTLSGIVNAGFLVYALYRKRLFKLTLLASRGTIFVVSAILSGTGFAYLIVPLERVLSRNFSEFAQYSTLIIAIIFALVTILFYKGIQILTDSLFVHEEQAQAQKLKQFSMTISKSLNLDEILQELVTVLTEFLHVEKAYVCLKDEQSGMYKAVCTASPLDPKDFCLLPTNPCAKWLESHDSCLILKDFQRSTVYKSMWEKEKKQLSDLKISCMAPLKCDNVLVGIVLLSEKFKNEHYTFDNVTFLDSIQSIVSIAINNARLYKKAYYEARIDHLTGLLNRKFFYERLAEEFEKCRDQSLALVILNLDDFKLYNQLYGNREGDLALQKISSIIKRCMGQNGIAARYGGKEFALILPKYDTMQAFELANEIKNQITEMNRDTDKGILKTLTLSGGICVYPYAASNTQQLVGNADMAVYNSKRNGKNRVIVYSMENPQTSNQVNKMVIKTDGYNEYAATIYALTAAIDAKDHYTFSHSQKVAEYATALARAIGLNEDHVKLINEAALLHDIGKIGIPEHILSKPGRLTTDEYEVMKQHVENSIAIIRHLPSLDYVIPATVAHHERWDGKGYPRGISGEEIPLSARCLSIADAFDAMTSERPYKQPLSVEFAISEIQKQAGLQFDPHLAEVFVKLIQQGHIKIG